MTSVAEVGEQSRRRYPWRRAALLVLLGMALYAAFPFLAPLTIAAEATISLLGIGLGLAVGVAVRLEARLVPALAAGGGVMVAVGATLEELPIALSLTLGLGVALEIWGISYLFRRTGASRLEVPADVLRLLVVSIGVAVPVAVLAAITLRLFGVDVDMFWHSVRSWATDDIFGLVVVAPALMLARPPRTWERSRALEFAIVSALTLVSVLLIFFRVKAGNPGLLGWPYLVLLGPAWIAVRLGASAVAPVATVMFWIAAVATAQDFGPFASSSLLAIDRLVAVEIFAIALTSGLLALGVLRDDRLRQLGRAEESSRLLREVVDGSDAAVFAKDFREPGPEGRYVLVNEAWERITGVSANDTLGRTDRELFGPELADMIEANDRQVLASNTPLVVEERNAEGTGPVRAFSSSKFPLRGEGGDAWGVGGISTDVTEAVHAREREVRHAELLRAVFELSPTPAMRMSVVGEHTLSVIDANAAMLALLGLPPGSVDRCDLMESVHPDDLATAWDIIGFALTTTGSHGPPLDAPA